MSAFRLYHDYPGGMDRGDVKRPREGLFTIFLAEAKVVGYIDKANVLVYDYGQ